jgi:hypothetical protein
MRSPKGLQSKAKLGHYQAGSSSQGGCQRLARSQPGAPLRAANAADADFQPARRLGQSGQVHWSHILGSIMELLRNYYGTITELSRYYQGTIRELAHYLGSARARPGSRSDMLKGGQARKSGETRWHFTRPLSALPGYPASDWQSAPEPLDCSAEALLR